MASTIVGLSDEGNCFPVCRGRGSRSYDEALANGKIPIGGFLRVSDGRGAVHYDIGRGGAIEETLSHTSPSLRAGDVDRIIGQEEWGAYRHQDRRKGICW